VEIEERRGRLVVAPPPLLPPIISEYSALSAVFEKGILLEGSRTIVLKIANKR
jgi:hypothetical protein